MSTIHCPHCNGLVYDGLNACPHCGGPFDIFVERAKEDAKQHDEPILAEIDKAILDIKNCFKRRRDKRTTIMAYIDRELKDFGANGRRKIRNGLSVSAGDVLLVIGLLIVFAVVFLFVYGFAKALPNTLARYGYTVNDLINAIKNGEDLYVPD